MDIRNITQNLSNALEQKNSEQLIALSRVLNLVLGKTSPATVISTSPVSESERGILLKQTLDALAQINKSQLTPAVKTEIERLLAQQQLIKSPALKWVELSVNNKPLTTYSDRPMTTGQVVQIQLETPQKLLLLNTTNQPPKIDISQQLINRSNPQLNTLAASTFDNILSTQNDAVKTKLLALINNILITNNIAIEPKPNNQQPVPNAAPTLNQTTESDAPIASSKLVNALTTADENSTGRNDNKSPIANANNLDPRLKYKLSTPTSASETASTKIDISTNKTATTNTLAADKIISESLRKLLPYENTQSELPKLVAAIENLPQPIRSQLLPNTVESALKRIAEQLRTTNQLSSPKEISAALKNSGVFFESKLKSAVDDSPNTNSSTTTKSTQPQSETNQKPLATNKPEASESKQSVEKILQSDMKAALLNLLGKITLAESNGKTALTTSQLQNFIAQIKPHSTQPFSSLLDEDALDSSTDANIATFFAKIMGKPLKELPIKELRTQLLSILQQHSLHSLAKIQLQQLHSLNIQNETGETKNTAVQVELPIKQHHSEVQHQPIQFRIESEWVNDNAEQRSSKPTQVKQWSVTLRFELPTLGEFCAQLNVIQNQVSATLWAEKENTFNKANKQLDKLRQQLESEGITLKFLQCKKGKPPTKALALSYSLIDIST